jgi:acetate kinase
MFVYRVRKYIGAYSAALSGNVDTLVFSAGIGENSSIIRGLVCADFEVNGGRGWEGMCTPTPSPESGNVVVAFQQRRP